MIGRFACCGLLLGLAAGCATPVRLLQAPQSQLTATARVVAVDIRIWGRFGRQTLPLRQAGLEASRAARQVLAATLSASICDSPAADPTASLDELLALYQRVANAWLVDPEAGRAGLFIGPGLGEAASGCATALILLGQQLPQPAMASNWLSLGAVNVADGRLLRLAAVPITAEQSLRRPEVLRRRVGDLLERLYR